MTIKAKLCCCALGALMAVACGHEGDLSPDFKNPSDSFLPSAADQSEEAQLRRQFFEQTGSYLLFTDTVQHELLGTDINGQPRYFTETIDLNYVVGQSAATMMFYTFTCLQTLEQKQQLTDFLYQYVLPHLTKNLRPYCWLVCDVINSYNDTYSTASHPYAASGQRCVAVAGNYLVQRERTDQQKSLYAQRILNAIVGQLAVNHSDDFAEFYRFNAEYYSANYSTFGYAGTPTAAELYTIGFLSSTMAVSFPSATTDLNSYALLVVQYTDEQLAQMYAAYPVLLQKAAIVRRVLVQLGYVF